MNLRPALQIQTMLRAMRETVIPAIDPANKMATEQAHLVMGMLALMQRTLPLAFRYDHDELTRALGLSDGLQQQLSTNSCSHPELTALASCSSRARDVLSRAAADPAELEAAVGELRGCLGAVVTAIFASGTAATRRVVSAAVLEGTRDQVLRERAWFASQGWESDPASIPAIDTLLPGSGLQPCK